VSILSAATVVFNGVQNSGASALSKPFMLSMLGVSLTIPVVVTTMGILVKEKLDKDKEEQEQWQKDKELKKKSDERMQQCRKKIAELGENLARETCHSMKSECFDRIYGLMDKYPRLSGILLCLYSNDEDKLLKRAIDGYKGEKLGERGEHVVYDYDTTNVRVLHGDWQQNAKEAIKNLKETFERYGDSFVVKKTADNCFVITFKNKVFADVWVIAYNNNIVNVERPYSNTPSSFTFRLASEYQFGLDKKLQ